jgi:hypothetical protein
MPESRPTLRLHVHERERLADFHATLYVPRDLPEERSDEIVAVLNDIDLRDKIEELIRWYLTARAVLRPVTLEVDE